MNSNSKSNSLMGDLESIKALLEEEDLEPVPEALSQALNPEPAPAQLNTFDPATGVSEPLDSAAEKAIAAPDYTDDAEDAEDAEDEFPENKLSEDDLDDELFASRNSDETTDALPPLLEDALPSRETLVSNTSLDALLGEEFHQATSEVMQRARALIDRHAHQWSPQQTDELADALRVRIDGAVEQWIQTSLAAHADELQQRLLNAVRNELARHLEAFESS